jgi:hypothetical protein
MTSSMINSKILINADLSIDFKLWDDKKVGDNIKLGQSGWFLFRKQHMKEFVDSDLNGNQKTSAIAKLWKKLTKDEKKWWTYSADHATECGNRWAMY